ncbi:probable LRR receptor-like serine/threonine-protein kinase RKF3 [Ricinus communis]|uniref:probable LRR receptor-like serine/threonine-protein kinase RKF3 n=1 Tax=Ricinus communis TaxID=3988 RepID=UPI00201AB73F|nr:probable LRR receptor-like serine/threonine-protein kinase RKF3 [Ricinus communis]
MSPSQSSLFQLVLLVFLLALFSNLSFATASLQKLSNRSLAESSCPLKYNVLRDLAKEAPPRLALVDVPTQCQYMQKGILLVRSEYLRTHGYFVPPPDTVQPCWGLYRKLVGQYLHDFDIQTTCGYHPEWISKTFNNITTRQQFESKIPFPEMQEMRLACNHSLENSSVCQSCLQKLLSLEKLYLQNPKLNNVSNASDYLFMYAAAFSSELGPSDPATANCLFRLEFSGRLTSNKKHKSVISGVVLGCVIGVVGASVAVWLFWMLHKKFERKKNISVTKDETSLDFGFGLHRRSTNLVKFKIDEIRSATMNFSRNYIIGKGGFGNVYKGILPDGSEVAFKRFKNCSASGDATFAHEVEIIASVRHVNLVALRGYCTATVPLECHQRIIVCDLMQNGSLHDHLFGSEMKKLSWPIRQKIALGTARGLAYLHHGVQPAIIHRDIKASNILLDETFEPKVADFGLAKFNSQGMTHLSTRVAGTLGYVAPEYALYGKLSERSDVYSFGVVLLELLSGRKAYVNCEGEVSLLTDWAWSLVKEGRALDVIEHNMPEMDSPKIMEQYVHIAAICAHPILYARPTMYQIVKILETNLLLVPSTLGVYISSGYMSSCPSITSDEQNSDSGDRDTEGSLTVPII